MACLIPLVKLQLARAKSQGSNQGQTNEVKAVLLVRIQAKGKPSQVEPVLPVRTSTQAMCSYLEPERGPSMGTYR